LEKHGFGEGTRNLGGEWEGELGKGRKEGAEERTKGEKIRRSGKVYVWKQVGMKGRAASMEDAKKGLALLSHHVYYNQKCIRRNIQTRFQDDDKYGGRKRERKLCLTAWTFEDSQDASFS
jgi:hypothetical protein